MAQQLLKVYFTVENDYVKIDIITRLNKGNYKKANRIYTQKNKMKILEQQKQYREANKDHITISKQTYRDNNKDKLRASSSKYYAENKDGKIKEYKTNDWTCPYCEKTITMQSKYSHTKYSMCTFFFGND
jgi:hypothetical protein